TPAWRDLADRPPGWLATWGAVDFEQITILAPDAQEDLLARQRHRLERCVTARELAQLVRSLTSDIAAFPWSPEDADLDPLPAPAPPVPTAAASIRACSRIALPPRSLADPACGPASRRA